MTRHCQHQIERETVERLLDGTAVDRRRVPEGLVRLLDAVRAAPLPDELRGEPAAVRAFHTARLAPAHPPPVPPARRGVLVQLLPLKTAVAALAVAATGGMALAAVQGALPNPLRPTSPLPNTTTDGGPGRSGPQPSASPDGEPSTPAGRTPGPEPSPGTPGAESTTGPGRPMPRTAPGRPGGSLPTPTLHPGIPTDRPTVPIVPPSQPPGGLTGQIAPPVGPSVDLPVGRPTAGASVLPQVDGAASSPDPSLEQARADPGAVGG
ncbi:hypothetical protein GA0074692_3288 [Micromonospora pallida]|uniref:Uncharacterized protein n=1 Tax=Micromonospora pallida TaxID=145854 RepID=A0A1C6SRQ9_9ACTN|nr:hypothetical protein [Micromonospora pallida]SCL32334.1 hypothetical protein GA0074692_3288 [Micromonospora pallida]